MKEIATIANKTLVTCFVNKGKIQIKTSVRGERYISHISEILKEYQDTHYCAIFIDKKYRTHLFSMLAIEKITNMFETNCRVMFINEMSEEFIKQAKQETYVKEWLRFG